MIDPWKSCRVQTQQKIGDKGQGIICKGRSLVVSKIHHFPISKQDPNHLFVCLCICQNLGGQQKPIVKRFSYFFFILSYFSLLLILIFQLQRGFGLDGWDNLTTSMNLINRLCLYPIPNENQNKAKEYISPFICHADLQNRKLLCFRTNCFQFGLWISLHVFSRL